MHALSITIYESDAKNSNWKTFSICVVFAALRVLAAVVHLATRSIEIENLPTTGFGGSGQPSFATEPPFGVEEPLDIAHARQ